MRSRSPTARSGRFRTPGSSRITVPVSPTFRPGSGQSEPPLADSAFHPASDWKVATWATSCVERWSEGGPALGAWISLRDPIIAETAASLGFDYVCVDLQHGLNDYDGMVSALAAMARTATTPLVRVPWNEPGIIGRVLDAGAAGVIIPMVNSVEEAQRAAPVRATTGRRWTRSFGPIALGARGGFAGTEVANDQVLCIPMIETREAVEQIDAILDVPGIDAVYIGPADLSITYGLRPGMDQADEEWNAAIAAVVASCVTPR